MNSEKLTAMLMENIKEIHRENPFKTVEPLVSVLAFKHLKL